MFEAICGYYGVTVGTYPNVNNDVMISTYDNSLTGKQYIMYLAELFGGNAKIQRDGSCSVIPLKNYTDIEIDALKSKKFEIGNTYELTRVCYNNLVKLYSGGNIITVDELPLTDIDENSAYYLTTDMKYYKYISNEWLEDTTIKNTLYIRPDNIFVSTQAQIDAIYDAVKNFSVTNITCENRMDLSIDCWDIVKFTTDNGEYYTYYDNTINYNGVTMGTVKVNIPSKLQEETTNVIENQKVINRTVKAEINQIDGRISLLSQEVSENTSDISSLELTASGISTSVTNLSNNLSNNYSTTTQMNSAINQKANEINLVVSTKVGEDEVVSSINQSSDKISLSSNRFEVNSNNSGIYDYNTYDVQLGLAYISDFIELPSSIKEALDYNDDGRVNVTDIISIINILNGTQSNNKSVTGKFKIKTDNPKNCIEISKDSETIFSVGVGGINSNMATFETIICGYVSSLSQRRINGVVIDGKNSKIHLIKNNVEHLTLSPTEISTSRGMVLSKETLYNNSSGSTGTISLSDSSSYCEYLGITYKDTKNLGTYQHVLIPNPSGKSVQLQIVSKNGTDVRLNSKRINISGSSITSDYGQVVYPIGSGQYDVNEIAIVTVDGYYE